MSPPARAVDAPEHRPLHGGVGFSSQKLLASLDPAELRSSLLRRASR